MSTKFNIADHAAVKKRVIELKGRSEDIKTRVAPTLKRLWNPERPLKQVTDFSVFQTLKTRFPNFTELINLWEGSAIGLTKTGNPFHSAPVLLVGEPGLGKTFFAEQAAMTLEMAYFELSMATASAGFTISGSSLQWAEGEVGFVAESLAKSEIANPILLLDEIDKAATSRRYDPLGPFYPLLEPHSARRFRDEALCIELDTSKIIWMATANYIDDIPKPIQDRMRIIHVSAPDPEQMPGVIDSIYTGIREHQSYGSLLDADIPGGVMECLVALSPRKIRQALEEATLNAIRHDRTGLLVEDLVLGTSERSIRYGFI